MRVFFTALLVWLFASHASAQLGTVGKVVSKDVTAASVTIYPDNLALITEVRRVTVPAGRSVIAFEGVSDLIIPQSMILREFTGITLERNFDYDLLGKTSLFEKSVGEVITLTRLDKASGVIKTTPATIISARRDSGVVVSVDGKTEVLSCSGLSERTQFDGLPDGLNPIPVMSIEVNAEAAGEQELVISYLASGLGWRADYRLDMTADDTASMLGWLTLTNQSAKSFDDVSLSIIAGDLNRRPETRAVTPPTPYLRAQCYPQGSTKTGIASRIIPIVSKTMVQRGALYAAAPEMMSMAMDEVIVTASREMGKQAVQENVGDYKLYRVPGAVSVKSYQTKQIAFINKPEIDVSRYFLAEVYRTNNFDYPTPLQTVYEIDNARGGLLDASLPKGTMRIFERNDRARLIFLGEDQIDNLAIDEPVRLKLGQSMNLQMMGRYDTKRAEDGGYIDARGEFRFYNATDAQSRVKFVIKDTKIRREDIDKTSQPFDADEIDPTWFITIAPEEAAALSFSKN